MDVAWAARHLDDAQRGATAVTQLTAAGELDVARAYEIQAAAYQLRLDRGERASGVKLGFTSRAKMAQMGISEIIVGRLTEEMRIDDGAEVDLDGLIHPRIEPEIAYLLAEEIDGVDPGGPAPSAIAAVAPALEIIDSRYRDFSFTLPDVVADNASSARYVLGPWTAPDRDVGNLAVRLDVAGRTVEIGSTAAILGHPTRALRKLVGLARSLGVPLRAGQVILAGAATSAAPLAPGPAECAIAGLGRAGVRGIRHA
ncbi:fumarylacetoacetate hydrolase family protein [Solwaraspora sp. WMMD1047]|uniref:2-keto-4-pentenoate hydratase n=1 Tax=Solwaraspora sp. WMMD1047 TaxID=3016102 RepID=UPI0024167412|nr:fumarylacetoacetate hydrolase family protein [Solwaraspora sp. WMMD1047]MDG4830577.1 fumarylacetoacetate hydrolase family protein [Solwaraspora sp. WMMD1047]